MKNELFIAKFLVILNKTFFDNVWYNTKQDTVIETFIPFLRRFKITQTFYNK